MKAAAATLGPLVQVLEQAEVTATSIILKVVHPSHDTAPGIVNVFKAQMVIIADI